MNGPTVARQFSIRRWSNRRMQSWHMHCPVVVNMFVRVSHDSQTNAPRRNSKGG